MQEKKRGRNVFPDEHRGVIRVFVKRKEEDESAQLHLYLFDDEPNNK